MEVVQQRAPLTMGWCINCHRQTVAEHAKDNKYYDKLMEAHSKYNKGQPMTIESIGGLECAKCHY
jgi:formate-dependent nitrite reductase cytochrome c552 subunit